MDIEELLKLHFTPVLYETFDKNSKVTIDKLYQEFNAGPTESISHFATRGIFFLTRPFLRKINRLTFWDYELNKIRTQCYNSYINAQKNLLSQITEPDNKQLLENAFNNSNADVKTIINNMAVSVLSGQNSIDSANISLDFNKYSRSMLPLIEYFYSSERLCNKAIILICKIVISNLQF